jgi:hypothetical protein
MSFKVWAPSPGQVNEATIIKKRKTAVCERSLAGITGSNPAGDMDVSLL